MDGYWKEDGTFEVAKGKGTKEVKGVEKGLKKGKGKGKKGKGKKGKGAKGEFAWENDGDDEPSAKKARMEVVNGKVTVIDESKEEEEAQEKADEEAWYETEWKDQEVCLINLKAAALNGTYGVVKQNMGKEKIMVDGKEKEIRRFMVSLEGGKGEKSIKMENLFKVMTGATVKLRGLDATELNDAVAECGRLDAAAMRYDVRLSDGRHLKVKPSNVEFVAKYETVKIGGDREQMEWVRNANGTFGILQAIEWYQYPVPHVIPASALAEYAKKFPKSIVIGQSKAGNPKGLQMLSREVTSCSLVPTNSRIIFVSMPRDRVCVGPVMEQMRHDELLRLGKFAEWVMKRCAPRPVQFLLPSAVVKGPTTTLSSATCAWPLYLSLCTDVVALESDRWQKSCWARLDAMVGAVWAKKPLYLLPEKYQPAIEMGDAPAPKKEEDLDEDVQNDAKTCPLSFRPEEPFTIARPTEGASGIALLSSIADRALEAESEDTKKVLKPCLAARRLG
eukprot:TRINITY_DN53202_c0_g1_i1.p1 TRINITY_DN53202_c0_g1~~TRINITY_DN53202_c0_g1_i1.p1  ORF type:complete len:504 (+),score=136.99 TRINITY_DN53202_c0_g1_i1:96-1607(+)